MAYVFRANLFIFKMAADVPTPFSTGACQLDPLQFYLFRDKPKCVWQRVETLAISARFSLIPDLDLSRLAVQSATAEGVGYAAELRQGRCDIYILSTTISRHGHIEVKYHDKIFSKSNKSYNYIFFSKSSNKDKSFLRHMCVQYLLRFV